MGKTWNTEQEINKTNWRIFLINNGLSARDYPYSQYASDMRKERSKNSNIFNARF